MVFDFNAWNMKWHDSNNPEEREFYWEKLQQAKEDFSEDWKTFLECYNNPNHVMRINDNFLDEKIEEILTKECCIPSPLNHYLIKRYPIYRETIMKIRENQWKNGMLSSVNAIGLKPMLANVLTNEDEKQLLLFEVWEFALTYPEYEDILIEEFIE